MSESDFIIDVTAQSFQTDVTEKSNETLVVVDFWATWCQPCQSLLPVMHRLAEEYAGKFILAKVDIDQNQALAQRFAVRSVPTVKFVRQGQVVDEFTGVLPEQEIRAKLEQHIVRASDQAFLDAFARYQQAGEDEIARKQALQQLIQVCNTDTGNNPIRIQLAKILLHESDLLQARQILEALPEPFRSSDEVKSLLLQVDMTEQTRDLPDVETLIHTVNNNPEDLNARLQLARQLVVLGDYENALQQLLEIIRQDRSFEDDIGRREMLRLFDMLSAAGEAEKQLANTYRRKLARYLN